VASYSSSKPKKNQLRKLQAYGETLHVDKIENKKAKTTNTD